MDGQYLKIDPMECALRQLVDHELLHILKKRCVADHNSKLYLVNIQMWEFLLAHCCILLVIILRCAYLVFTVVR